MVEEVNLKRVKNARRAFFSGFHLLVPNNKPTTSLNLLLEITRDFIAVLILTSKSFFTRYSMFVLDLPVLSLTPGHVSERLSTFKTFDYIDKFMFLSVLRGRKLVTYCNGCNFHSYRNYKFNSDYDFWEISDDHGNGLCMECAGKTQADWIKRFTKCE